MGCSEKDLGDGEGNRVAALRMGMRQTGVAVVAVGLKSDQWGKTNMVAGCEDVQKGYKSWKTASSSHEL